MKTAGRLGVSMNLPRSFRMGTALPSTDCAAVEPKQTTIFGFTAANSAFSHGLHAITSRTEGFWCKRLLPRQIHLKCLTALVT